MAEKAFIRESREGRQEELTSEEFSNELSAIHAVGCALHYYYSDRAMLWSLGGPICHSHPAPVGVWRSSIAPGAPAAWHQRQRMVRAGLRQARAVRKA